MNKEAVLISACLVGTRCRYDGKLLGIPESAELMEKYFLVPACPETLGGLPTPREPCELCRGRVLAKNGADVTENFARGAEETVRLARLYGCRTAVLRERSPSCGSGLVYDGSFSGVLTPGDGVCAAALKAAGVRVLGDSRAKELF